MEFDEQFGPVERGTPGVRASAQGDDVGAEVAALDRIHVHTLCDAGDVVRRALARGGERHVVGFDVGQGSATAFTTYAVDGDTLHIVQAVTIPTRAQTVTVRATIGGE